MSGGGTSQAGSRACMWRANSRTASSLRHQNSGRVPRSGCVAQSTDAAVVIVSCPAASIESAKLITSRPCVMSL